MASWTRRAVVLGVLAGMSGVVASACADNNQSLFIRQVQSPESGQCSYTNDPTADHYMSGFLDLMLVSEYRAVLLVGNQLVPRGNADMVRAETSRIQLDEAEVTVEFSDGTEINSFTIPGNGFVDPSSGSEPGWGVFGTVLIDSNTGKALLSALQVPAGQRGTRVGRVVAVVKVFGKTLGGKDVESGEFRFPIEVCYGCSVSFPQSRWLDDGVTPVPNCQGCADVTDLQGACTPGQDSTIDCCKCHELLDPAGSGLCEPSGVAP
jgi:hypothetical protein